MKELIRTILREVYEEDEIEKYTPQFVYNYINKQHRKGWEKKKFDDKEWVLSHNYFLLQDIKLGDESVKWNYGQHPPIITNYSKLNTEIPPIVISSNGYIIDGTHRVGAAKLKGEHTIRAFVGY